MWLELELDAKGEEVHISGRGSRGERPPARTLARDRGFDALQTLATRVARAAHAGRALDPAVINDSQALYEAVFTGEIRDVLARLVEASKDDRLLIRLLIRDRALQSIPWEAL